jgi:hypothetical protein
MARVINGRRHIAGSFSMTVVLNSGAYRRSKRATERGRSCSTMYDGRYAMVSTGRYHRDGIYAMNLARGGERWWLHGGVESEVATWWLNGGYTVVT